MDVSGSFLIEVLPCAKNDVLLVGAIQAVAEQAQYHGEVHWTLRFVEHRFQFSVVRCFACVRREASTVQSDRGRYREMRRLL